MKGLSTPDITLLREEHGLNELEAKAGNPWYKILLEQFKDLLVLVLVVAAIISGFHDPIEAFVIVGIVLLNAGIGFFQEFRTEKTLEALRNMVHPEIRVVRGGEEQLIETKYLVPGDIVLLGEGDKIPADGVIVESHSFRVEESALTGESVPVEKKIDDEVFMGTSVAKGSAIFKVQSIGMNTQFGKIAELTTSTDKTKSPLQIELGRIGVFVVKVTALVCLVIFVFQAWRTLAGGEQLFEALRESLIFSVSVAIAAVPEGLPTTITVALALGASVLARKKAIVKKLSSVETLGAVTTICSDKTGTLTKNEMTVREVYLPDRSIFNVSGVGYNPQSGELQFIGGNNAKELNVKSKDLKNTSKSFENTALLRQVMNVCRWCNEAKLVKKEGMYRILGDPTEGSLLTLANKYDLQCERQQNNPEIETDHRWIPVEDKTILEVFPFDSDRKMMSVVVKGTHNKKVLVKGSPDHVLEHCTHWFDGNKTHPLNDEKREHIMEHYERMAGKALRVLACAYKEVDHVPEDEYEAEDQIVFTGLVGMIDPPREEVKDAVEKCHTAGIRVVVITGDYGVTARAIASELGIVETDNVRVFTGNDVQAMSDEELSDILADKNQGVIFARSLPEQKMKIVEILQKQGEIVAMTGDGVNDAPALKKANIGVAMGITGTEVSKEAATMILLNDSFASIVKAIEEGRRIYENLKKFIWFIFSSNIGELFVIFAAVLVGFPAPLTAVLILCVDLGTDILPAIALGVDNGDKDLMKQPPRDVKKRVMNRSFVEDFLITGTVMGICMTGLFLYDLFNEGWIWGTEPDTKALIHAQSVAFASIVVVQLFNAFAARSRLRSMFTMNPFNNAFLLVATFTSTLLVLVMLYVPFMNTILKTAPLSLETWYLVVVVSLLPILVVEAIKAIRRSGLKTTQSQ